MILQFKDVVLGYENKTVAKDINFEIKKGDYLCIVGENGAGIRRTHVFYEWCSLLLLGDYR